jgi:hypothetical protein
MLLVFDKAKLDSADGRWWVSLRVEGAESLMAARKFLHGMPDKLHQATLERHSKKRSESANAYMWVLCDKIAQAIRSTKEEVYREMIGRAGVFTHLYVHVDEARRVAMSWQNNGLGWLTEFMETRGEYVTIRAYVGSSKYDKAEMARLLDEVVNEAQELGLETKTPDELAKMKDLWQS